VHIKVTTCFNNVSISLHKTAVKEMYWTQIEDR